MGLVGCDGGKVGLLLLNKCGRISSNFFNLISKKCICGHKIKTDQKYRGWHLGKLNHDMLLQNIIYFLEMLILLFNSLSS